MRGQPSEPWDLHALLHGHHGHHGHQQSGTMVRAAQQWEDTGRASQVTARRRGPDRYEEARAQCASADMLAYSRSLDAAGMCNHFAPSAVSGGMGSGSCALPSTTAGLCDGVPAPSDLVEAIDELEDSVALLREELLGSGMDSHLSAYEGSQKRRRLGEYGAVVSTPSPSAHIWRTAETGFDS